LWQRYEAELLLADLILRCYVILSLWKRPQGLVRQEYNSRRTSFRDASFWISGLNTHHNIFVGYPPARLWGCPTTGMWIYRVGLTWAKRMLLTGDLIDGKTAEKIGLAYKAVPESDLDAEVDKIVQRMASVPKNQLAMQKLVINQAVEAMGLFGTQKLATLMDGVSRHSPEGVAWKARAEAVGMKKAIQERDSNVAFVLPAAKL
jgi:enoyl-CoA hydratase